MKSISRKHRAAAAFVSAMIAGACWSGTAAANVTYFTASANGPASVTLTDQIRGPQFFFGYYAVQVVGGCGAGNGLCLDAGTLGGQSLGSFGLSIVSSPFNYLWTNPADGTQSAIAGTGGYFEHFGGYGDVILAPLFANQPALLTGASNFNGFSIYAAPGSNSATIEFDLDSFAASNILNLPSVPLYLDITGITTTPVSLYDLTPGANPDYLTFTAPLTIDFTITLSDTPYTPTVVTPPVTGVPEPWSWTMMLAGLAALAGLRRARRITAK